MKRIYLIRHGECDSRGTYVGRGTDLSLNAEGRVCTAALAVKLKSEGINPVKIITSSQLRARESAQIMTGLFEYTFPLLEDSRLDEMNFGQWEGLNYDEICRQFPGESQKWINESWETPPPGGESSRELSERVTDFYQDFLLTLKEEVGEIILIGHGGSLRMLLCLFMGVPTRNQWQFRLDRSGVAGIDLCGDVPVLFRLNS